MNPAGNMVLLVGAPNAGKSLLFTRLTGSYAHSGNFPGTTVAGRSGLVQGRELVDVPGIYGLGEGGEEVRIALHYLEKAAAVLVVADASALARDLFLALQVRDLGIPMVLILNKWDRVPAGTVAPRLLSEELGVPVVPVSSRSGEGMAPLRALLRSQPSPLAATAPGYAAFLRHCGLDDNRRVRLAYEGVAVAAARLGIQPVDPTALYAHRQEAVQGLLRRVVRRASGHRFDPDRLLLHPRWGLPLLALLLFVLYGVLGVLVAGGLVDLTEGYWMKQVLLPRVEAAFRFLPPGPLAGLVTGPYGLLTSTVPLMLGLLLPLVGAFYLAQAVLEESGLLARMAVQGERGMRPLGLSGEAVIPFLLGLGCVTMATAATRLLPSRRERRIALILLAIGIPCSAQLAVVLGLLAPHGPAVLLLYGGAMLLVFVLLGTLLGRVYPGGGPSDLFLALPPLSLPPTGIVLPKTARRTGQFLREAWPLFIAGNGLLALLDSGGFLQRLLRLTAPVAEGWLHLPRQVLPSFLMGMIRRDFGAAGLLSIPLTTGQALTAALVITLFVPCLASTLLIIRQEGWTFGLALWLAAVLLALLTGGLLARLPL